MLDLFGNKLEPERMAYAGAAVALVGRDGILRAIGNRPLTSRCSANGWQAGCHPVGMALRATKGDENAQQAGRGASRGPGGPPYFGLVFDRAPHSGSGSTSMSRTLSVTAGVGEGPLTFR
jgi:hypothetical protein